MDLQDLSIITNYIKGFGLLAPLIAFIIFVAQAILPIFPFLILAAASGILFGFTKGFLIAWLGALAGACIFYWICRWIGFDKFQKYFAKRFNIQLKKIPSETAFWSLLIARIIPVVPTTLINASAALGGISFWNFFFSSALGKMPTAFLYTGIGLYLFNIQDVNLALGLIAAVLAISILGRYMLKKAS